MAASNLTSPPLGPTLHDRLLMLSSSPDLPDLRDLIAKKPKPPTLRSGSAAAPIPENATKAFTTAADILRTAQANDDDTLDTIDEPERPPVNKVPAKRVRKPTRASTRKAKEVVVLSSDGVAPKDDEETNTETGETGKNIPEGNTLEEKPWKKFKTLADVGDRDGETLVQTAEAVESAKPPSKTRAQRRRTSKPETVSKHFAQKPVAQQRATKASTPEPLNLESAVQRRTDWTPPRADTKPETDPFDVSVVISQVGEGGNVTDKIEIFRNLHDAYGHKRTDVDSASTKQQAAKVLGKRKVIEMVSVNQSSKMTDERRTPSPVKEKAPKKKPRTITELATAAYISKVAEPEEESRDEDTILEYFTVDNEGQDAAKTAAAKAKGKGKAAKVTKNTKRKVPSKQAILLSPEAAIRQSARQDFVFGTSSQLTREHSPSFLKDLQTALRASNIAKEDDPSASISGQAQGTMTKKPNRGLWAVSARDEAGKLVDVEAIDLVDSPAFPDDDSVAILNPWKDLPLEPAKVETADSSLVEIGSRPVPANGEESAQSPIPKSHFFMSQHKATVNSATATTLESSSRPSFPNITDLLEDEPPPPSNQQQSQEEVRTVSTTTTNPIQKPQPKYELFTDAKLAKEVSSYGFKAIKTRSAMIALLDQCWKSKNQAPLAGLPFSTSSLAGSPKGKKTAATTTSAASASPVSKKPRGRPKKTTSAIDSNGSAPADDEVPATPVKKRGRPRKDAATTVKTATRFTPSPPKPRPTISTPKRKKAATRKPTSAALESDVDSEAGLTSPEQVFSSPLAVDVSVSEDTEMSLTLSPTAQQSALFSHISKAVTSAPRTTDPEDPSWHEKMLMYDPVILEDLTAWLNSGQLTQAGYDGEVAPADVKKWCESKSVCCLWRVSYHGKERKRV